MKNKQIGLILIIIGIIGALASLLIIFLIKPCCTLFIETYHQMLLLLIPIFLFVSLSGSYLFFKMEKVIKKVVKQPIEKIEKQNYEKIIKRLTDEENQTKSFLGIFL